MPKPIEMQEINGVFQELETPLPPSQPSADMGAGRFRRKRAERAAEAVRGGHAPAEAREVRRHEEEKPIRCICEAEATHLAVVDVGIGSGSIQQPMCARCIGIAQLAGGFFGFMK